MRVFNKILIVIFISFFLSCSGFKEELTHGVGNKNQAIDNVITDFAYTYRTQKVFLKEKEDKAFDVFEVFEEETKNDTWNFIIYPELDGHVSLSVRDSIGKVPKVFPNQYMIKNEKLFIWNDSKTPLREGILKVLDEFGVLDSTDIKRELGMLPSDFEDTRMVTIDHRLNNGHYIVCKNNVGKYKKKFTNRSQGFYEKTNSGRFCR